MEMLEEQPGTRKASSGGPELAAGFAALQLLVEEEP
tara:strand:+ start:13044 stop:13151 length:108 start_codon:yes stop_codon:yes gene_type:complete